MTPLAAGVAASRIVRGRGARYPIAFSTLGCPSWTWKTILDQADRLGYAAIELRGVAGGIGPTQIPELSGAQVPPTKKDTGALGGTGFRLGGAPHPHGTGRAPMQDTRRGS